MKNHYINEVTVGLRDKETNNLISVYPEPVTGNFDEIEDKVKFWYYQQSCDAEEKMRNYFVDTLSAKEVEEYMKSR